MSDSDSAILIRPAQPCERDVEGICRVGSAAFRATFSWQVSIEEMDHELGTKYSPAVIGAGLASSTIRTWVADDPGMGPGEVVGFITLRTDNPETADLDSTWRTPIEIQRLYISHSHHGRGLGARLVTAALEWARKEGYGSVWLGVDPQNPIAIRFYEKRGFRKIGEHPFEWSSGRIDMDQVMARTL